MAANIDKFVHDQLSLWPSIAAKYRALKLARTRTLPLGGMTVTLQSNPGRLPIFDHGCPLCEENYMEHQHTLPFEGRKGRKYNILVNRAPIFPNHLVITRDIHTPQTIWHRFPDMLDLAEKLDDYLVFYNSPHSGTTVPEHAHFQACPKGYMPLERVADRILKDASPDLEPVESLKDASLYHFKRFNRGIFMLKGSASKSMAKLFYRLLDCLNLLAEESEPRFNAYAWRSEGEYRAMVILRDAERSGIDFSLTPGAADMAGFIVVPEPKDFDRLDAASLERLFEDVSISPSEEERLLWRLVRSQPRLKIEIASGESVRFEIISDGAGPQTVSLNEGKIDYGGALYDEMVFEAATISTLFAQPSFIIYGADGPEHYAGTLSFSVADGKLKAVNTLGLEDYLLGVVSLLPEEGRREAAIALRRSLQGREEVSAGGPRYIGLTPGADAAARTVIDETWGQI